MPKFKKLLSLLLTVCLIAQTVSALCLTSDALPHGSTPTVSAQSAVLMLADGETVVYNKEANLPLPMASTTKIMTALVALELASPDTLITVDPIAVGTEGSSVYLVAGEKLTLEQLLYALLLESANDAAVAIAVALSGSIEAFAREMNRRAASLGLEHTHFENPHGLDHEEHQTTALELAKIACAAIRIPLLRTIVSTRKTTIPHPAADTVRLLVNHNKLLRLYDGCIGVKTGYTQRSGRCLVSAAERDGVTLVAVTLNASGDWEDHARMLDYGFSSYRAHRLCEVGALTHTLPVVGGTESTVPLTNTEGASVILPANAGKIEMRIECRPFEYAAVTEGSVYGDAVFLCDTDGNGVRKEIARVPLCAVYTVEKQPRSGFWEWICAFFARLLRT